MNAGQEARSARVHQPTSSVDVRRTFVADIDTGADLRRGRPSGSHDPEAAVHSHWRRPLSRRSAPRRLRRSCPADRRLGQSALARGGSKCRRWTRHGRSTGPPNVPTYAVRLCTQTSPLEPGIRAWPSTRKFSAVGITAALVGEALGEREPLVLDVLGEGIRGGRRRCRRGRALRFGGGCLCRCDHRAACSDSSGDWRARRGRNGGSSSPSNGRLPGARATLCRNCHDVQVALS
jgi:hypothetical protein